MYGANYSKLSKACLRRVEIKAAQFGLRIVEQPLFLLHQAYELILVQRRVATRISQSYFGGAGAAGRWGFAKL